MFDSVTLSAIPPAAPAVAGYVNGNWPTYNQVVVKWPQARHLSISVNQAGDAECLDVEGGDATPDQAPAWILRQQARGVARPVVYTSVSAAQTLLNVLAHAGIPRASVRLWTAHYIYTAHLCGPGCGYGLTTTADATQWTDRSLGRNLDESLTAESFFGATPPPAPSPDPPVTISHGTLGGQPVAVQIVGIQTDANGDGSVPAPPGFLAVMPAGAHDKYDPNTQDGDSLVFAVGARASGSGWRLVVAHGPASSVVGAPVLVSD